MIRILLHTTLLFILIALFSCKKDLERTDHAIVGEWNWSIQYTGNPAYSQTPQNTGIQEKLIFNNTQTWSLIRNGTLTASGTYQSDFATNSNGQQINRLHFYTGPGTDSVCYYRIQDNANTLMFSPDLMGTIGGGSRIYIK